MGRKFIRKKVKRFKERMDMEKTKLGVSVGLFAAFVYAAAFLGGYVPAILVLGYVLLMESDEWLKKTAVKAVATLVIFGVLVAIVGLIPEGINWLASVINVFGANIRFEFLNDVFGVVKGFIGVVKDVAFLGLIVKALKKETIKLPVIDDLIEKYM